MNRALFAILVVALAGALPAAQAAGNAAAGKSKVAACAGCHGANGEGKNNNPALAGKSEAELAQALNEYKSGKRTNAVMKTFAAKLSEQDVADVSAYYAALKAK